MDYIIYKPDSFPKPPKKRKSYIRLTVKSGKIVFSAGAVTELELNKGGNVHFLQDAKVPFNWYIRKTKDKDSFTLTVCKNGTVTFGCRPLVQKLAGILNVADNVFKVAIGNQQNENGAWALITAPFVSTMDRPKA